MSDLTDQFSLDDILANPQMFPAEDLERARSERVLGATAILIHRQGDVDTADLLADVNSLALVHQETDWGIDYFDAVLEVEPDLLPRFTPEVMGPVLEAMQEATSKDQKFEIRDIRARPVIPPVGQDWRKQLRAANGPTPTNQARKVRLEPEDQHPIEDDLHFTNKWEHGLYQVLKARQAALPDNETIGIMPLGKMRLLGSTREPDFLITYKGRAGVIEVDGFHHGKPGRASNDHSRDNLMYNAGVRWVGRLDVQDVNTKAEVEKFVDDFLARLVRQ
ncbi:hypothetical protein ACFYR2_27700 [Streptomyces microflavus]|uniref:hypothetical protein n=1 Tax=Streptomyces microflavus TaxID=1919 RepID=UPI0036B80B4A